MFRLVCHAAIAFSVALAGVGNGFAQEPLTITDSRGDTAAFPSGVSSFADDATSFRVGQPAPTSASNLDKANTLGAPDGASLTHGCGGSIVLRFTDNVLINVQGPDLYIFEVGPDVESTQVEVSVTGNGDWIEIGPAEGSASSIDIFYFTPPGAKFRFVRLTDLRTNCESERTPGADIDAVGAIGSAPTPRRCAPPARMGAQMLLLIDRINEASRRNEDLPDAVLYRRDRDNPPANALSMRRIINEQVDNGGPDNLLVRGAAPGGMVSKVVDEVTLVLRGDRTCDAAAWTELAARLRTLKRPFDDKLMFVRGSLTTARDTAQQAGSEIRDLLANTRADNDVWVRIVRYLGVSEDAALAIPNGVTGLSTAAVLVLWKYNPVLGPLSAIFSTLKVFNAGQDLADLRRASRLVPEFLEMSESEAWLEPLDLSYAAVNEPFQAVIEIMEAYDP